jgi:hypothetical protein
MVSLCAFTCAYIMLRKWKVYCAVRVGGLLKFFDYVVVPVP